MISSNRLNLTFVWQQSVHFPVCFAALPAASLETADIPVAAIHHVNNVQDASLQYEIVSTCVL